MSTQEQAAELLNVPFDTYTIIATRLNGHPVNRARAVRLLPRDRYDFRVRQAAND